MSVHLSVDEVAALLITTPRNVRRFIADGTLPAMPNPSGARGRVVPSEAVHALKEKRETDKGTDGQADTKRVRPPVRERFVDEGLVEHLRGEVEFLRARNAELNAVVMQQARALATQTVERPAIEAASQSVGSAQNRTDSGEMSNYVAGDLNTQKTAQNRAQTSFSSYAAISDWLESIETKKEPTSKEIDSS